jgi:prephenate dehydrogenase
MAKPKITIVGLGLIGKSIGKALRAVGGQLEVVGHDREPVAAREAQKVEAVDKIHWNLIGACEGADIVVIATPLQGVRQTLEVVASDLKAGCLVMDTAPLKLPVVKWADELLPPGINFVGGHPILSAHAQIEPSTSEDQSSSDLLKETLFCVVPSANASPDGIHLATDVVRLLGAKPFFVDAVEHDGLAAGVDQLPLVAALSLLRTTSAESSWREMRKLAGPVFEDVTRVLSQDLENSRDMLLLNRENILRLIENWVDQLYELRELIRGEDGKGLQGLMEASVTVHQAWLQDRGVGLWEQPGGPEIQTGGGFLGRMLGLGRK